MCDLPTHIKLKPIWIPDCVRWRLWKAREFSMPSYKPTAHMSECTQPPSYDSYVPLEDDSTITVTERLPPEGSGVPFMNASTPRIIGQRPSNVRDELEDVIMTWNNGREIVGHSTAVEVHTADQHRGQAQASPPQQPKAESSAPLGLTHLSPFRPTPNHVAPQRPKKKITYTFSPIGPNGMVLLPPARAQDSCPQYYIAVSLNCFMPLSHITTVYRGANENAPRVGEFELGIISVSNSRVQMGNGPSVSLLSVLTKHGSRENARWSWKPDNQNLSHLYWDASTVPFECKVKFAGSEVHILVAQFTSNMQPIVGPFAGPKPTPALSQLEVLPAGQKCFDDILMSLLVVERKRLTPKTKTEAQLRTLFNY